MLESSVSLSRSFYFEDIIEPRVKDLGARRISGGSRRIWTATQIISAGLRPRQVWFCSQPQWTSQPSWMFAAFTVIACSVELTQRIKLTHQHVWHWSLNSQSLKITLNLSFLPPGNWCRKGKVKKIRDKRKKYCTCWWGQFKQRWSPRVSSWSGWCRVCAERPGGWSVLGGRWRPGSPGWLASGRKTQLSPLWWGRSWPRRSYPHDQYDRYDGCSLEGKGEEQQDECAFTEMYNNTKISGQKRGFVPSMFFAMS